MFKISIYLAAAAAVLVAGNTSHADKKHSSNQSTVVDATMSTLADTAPSGSGDTILDNCGASSGHQSAKLKITQKGAGSRVQFKIRRARADTVYTVWLRIKGGPGHNDSGSPLTGGGATPLVPGWAIDAVNEFSPWGSVPQGNASPMNGFTTDRHGNATWSIDLDFPVVRGAYPFHLTAVNAPGQEGEPNVAKAIPNPDDGNGGPFLLRVISHCTDGVGHGLSPGIREAWFQYP